MVVRQAPLAGDALDRLLDERLWYRDATTDRFLPLLLGDREGVCAVVFYGSRLLGARDAEPDFFLVVDDPGRFLRRPAAWLLSRVLPPLVVHRRLPGADGGDPCKVCVVGADQLRRETSAQAADLYHLGRFAKRVGLVWARNRDARRLVREAQRSSLERCADHALALLPDEFTLDGFLLALLGLSYRAEPRVVEPGKIERIFAADPDAYRSIGRLLLARRAASIGIATRTGVDRYLQPTPTDEARRATLQLLARSRTRALLRWPKNMLTFDGWADYAIGKAERHAALALPPRARRHPLVFGWPHLLQLRRAGLLR